LISLIKNFLVIQHRNVNNYTSQDLNSKINKFIINPNPGVIYQSSYSTTCLIIPKIKLTEDKSRRNLLSVLQLDLLVLSTCTPRVHHKYNNKKGVRNPAITYYKETFTILKYHKNNIPPLQDHQRLLFFLNMSYITPSYYTLHLQISRTSTSFKCI